MRVTQDYSVQSLLRQVNRTRERINLLQRNLSTGKRINQISDDPSHIETVLRYRKMLKMNSRFEENIQNASEFLGFTSNALDESADIIAKVKELTIQGVDSTSPEEFQAFVEQFNEMLQKLTDVANTQFKGRYIFGGKNVKTAPFTLAPDLSSVTANPEGVTGQVKTELGRGMIDPYNISGQEAFQSQVDIFQTLIDLRDAFAAQDSTAIRNLMPDIDASMNQVLDANTRAGAKINRYELLLAQYENEDLRLQEYLSGVEDTDIPRAIVELQGQQTSLETSLKTLAQTVGISLVDFI